MKNRLSNIIGRIRHQQNASEADEGAAAGKVKPVIGVIVVAVILIVMVFILYRSSSTSNAFKVSGTIETTEVHLGTELGGRVESVAVKEGEKVQNGQLLIEVHASGTNRYIEQINSPIDGVVIDRSIEPGEVAVPGASLLTLGNLDDLTLTVYVPEDRYGVIQLGQTYPVSVDSFPGQIFNGTVSHIADQAEFTPHNVQTVAGRKTTVFAIRLDLEPSNGKLKPGMPADVDFSVSP